MLGAYWVRIQNYYLKSSGPLIIMGQFNPNMIYKNYPFYHMASRMQ